MTDAVSARFVTLLESRRPRFVDPTDWRPIRKSLPFVAGNRGGYVHRVRAMTLHQSVDGGAHVHADCWCGQVMMFSNRHGNELLAEPPDGRVVCATCEARAIGAGQVGAGEIGGRPVKFSPHRPKPEKRRRRRDQ